MNWQTYILPAALAVTLFSCNINKQEDAMRLSNELGFANDSLFYYGKLWNDELKVAVNLSDFSKLQPIRKELEDYILRKEAYITKMEDVGSSQELRQSELDYLAFEKNIVKTKFMPFENFDANTPTDELARAYEELLNSMEQEKPKLDRFQGLQQAYAEKNGFPKPIGDIE